MTDRAEPGVTPLTAEELDWQRKRHYEDEEVSGNCKWDGERLPCLTLRFLATLDAATPRPGLVEGMPLPNEEVHVSGRHEDCEVETPHYHRRPIRAALANDKGADPTPEPSA